MAVSALSQENFWVNKSTYDAAERSHYERLYKVRLKNFFLFIIMK